jgi:hypothetical protein
MTPALSRLADCHFAAFLIVETNVAVQVLHACLSSLGSRSQHDTLRSKNQRAVQALPRLPCRPLVNRPVFERFDDQRQALVGNFHGIIVSHRGGRASVRSI